VSCAALRARRHGLAWRAWRTPRCGRRASGSILVLAWQQREVDEAIATDLPRSLHSPESLRLCARAAATGQALRVHLKVDRHGQAGCPAGGLPLARQALGTGGIASTGSTRHTAAERIRSTSCGNNALTCAALSGASRPAPADAPRQLSCRILPAGPA
jgi:hypothetical protein